MINQNDLYDITHALTLIRNDICEGLNIKVLLQISDVLVDKSNFDDNQVRTAISCIDGLDRKRWYFAYHNNVYINHRFLKNEYIYKLFLNLLKELICILEKKDFDRAYDLADCFHCLPEIIADNHFIIPKSFWKTYVKYYRDKWDNTFLLTDQKFFNNRRIKIRGTITNTGDGSMC